MQGLLRLTQASMAIVLITGCVEGKTPDWETFQGNAAHTGHIAKTYRPQEFSLQWTFDTPAPTSQGFINPPASGAGLLYVTQDGYHENQQLFALRETDGSIAWSYDFGTIAHVNPPAFKNGKVYVTSSGHQDTFLWMFDAATGELQGKTPFNTQWPQYLAPTVANGIVYNNSGYYGGQITAFSATDASWIWDSATYGDDDMYTPAVTAQGVYHYSGTGLHVLNTQTGELVRTIEQTSPIYTGYSMIGAPASGSRNNIISFSGGNFSGWASSSAEGYDPRELISFDLGSNSMAWISEAKYYTHPAIADGQVYAGRSSPVQLDAIDEGTGGVTWSWVPSDDSGITRFHHNIVSTKNLIFVVSNIGVHAISKSTKAEVWNYPHTGSLAISSNDILYITEGLQTTTGHIKAISLKPVSANPAQ